MKTKLAVTHLPLQYSMLLILLLAYFGSVPSYTVGLMMPPSPCLPSQEGALLKFKAGLTDPSGRLKSWRLGVDCCTWKGITCDNQTGYLSEIHLHNPQNPYDNLPFDHFAKASTNSSWYSGLGSQFDPALADLKRLQYLDLSFNTFDRKVRIPEFLGFMTELVYLDLSYAGFGGKIPSSIGNLSMLEYLDLASLVHNDHHSKYPQLSNDVISPSPALISYLNCDDLQWMAGLISLKAISMQQVNLSMVRHEPMYFFSSLPSLEDLVLTFCSFSKSLNLPFSNFSSLKMLDFRYTFSPLDFPNWVVNVTTLTHLDMRNSYFEGEVPYALPELPYLNLCHPQFK